MMLQRDALRRISAKDLLRQIGLLLGLMLFLVTAWLGWGGQPAAFAGLTDDRYDGNIFALYAGNGSLVPPRTTLEQSLKQGRPALLVIYVDDSSECKQYASVISQLQGPYSWATSIIPIMADSISVKDRYEPTEPGYYFDNAVPKTVIFDAEGKVVLNEAGVLSYERLDDALREVFDLLPRTESEELRRRSFNEVNTELVPD
nr:thylakoid membrane photosystem I accumulation factor [Pseudanabaena sp. FACHB-2040]